MYSDSRPHAAVSYLPIEDVEPFERYCSGGYHLVKIGDSLQGHYDIVHKLGFGSSSTIWLARDRRKLDYVAIKVSTASNRCVAEAEAEILHYVGASAEGCPGSNTIPWLKDSFEVRGPNGSHRCLVTAPARMSVAEAREASYKRMFQLPVARAIVAQLVEAVALLHSCGVVHGGKSSVVCYVGACCHR